MLCMAAGKAPRIDFRDPIKRKPGVGRGLKPAK